MKLKKIKKNKAKNTTSFVDKTLVSMFLKMTPEERLQANDNAARAILELQDAYRKQKNKNIRFGLNN